MDERRKRRRREAKKRYLAATERHDASLAASGAMLFGINHAVRRELLRMLNAATGPLSPKELADQIPWDLPSVSFHCRELAARDLATCTHTLRVKGSTQHFYVSTVVDNELLAAILASTQHQDRLLFAEVL